MFWIKNKNKKKKKKKKKKKVYPLKPQFFNIKVGFEGVHISRTCFPDDTMYYS